MNTRTRSLVAALCLAAVAVVLTPSPATALSQWSYSDGLENTAWEGGGDGGFGHRQYGTPTASHSGTHYGWIYAYGVWGGIGRPLTLPARVPHYMGCRVYWNVRPLEPVTRFNVEVIDPDTWTYVFVRTMTLTAPAEGYRPYEYVTAPGSFVPTKANVYIRISAIPTASGRSEADVDDMTIQCTGR